MPSPHRYRPLLPLCLLLAPACASEAAPPPPKKTATHSWSSAPEQSLFSQVELGTIPPVHADAWMPVLPGIVHRAGIACETQLQATGKSSVTLQFQVTEGQAKRITVDPPALKQCWETVLAGEQEALTRGPQGGISLWLTAQRLAPATVQGQP